MNRRQFFEKIARATAGLVVAPALLDYQPKHKKSKFHDLYISQESLDDIRNWCVDEIDEVTRKEILCCGDTQIRRVFSISIGDINA